MRQLDGQIIGQHEVGNAPEAGDALLEVDLQRFGALSKKGNEDGAAELHEHGALVERHARDAAPRTCAHTQHTDVACTSSTLLQSHIKL